MLNALRSSAGSFVTKGLLILLAFSFVIWGVTDYVGGGGAARGSVASVGDGSVEPIRFLRALDQDVNQMRSVFGPTFTREQAQAVGLVDQTIGRLVGEVLIAEEASDLGIAIDDDIVLRNVSREESFQGLIGGFDRDRFRQLAAQLGYTEQGFLEQVRNDAARDQLLSAVSGHLHAPNALLDAMARYQLERRVVSFMTLPDASNAAVPAPSEQDLIDFHADNTAVFTTPELRSVVFVSLNAEDLADSIEVTEAELAEAFDIRKDTLTQPEVRRVLQMILPDEDAARAAKTRLDGGESFADVAQDAANMNEAAIDLGLTTINGLLAEMAEAVFTLSLNQSTQPIKTVFGWHIATVPEIQGGEAPTFADVRDELLDEMRNERAADELYAVSTRLEDEIGGGATLEEAARALNLSVVRLPAIARNGTDVTGQPIDGLPGDGREFLIETFQGDIGLESVLTETGDDGYFVVRVDKISPPRLQPVDEIRSDIIAAWEAEQRQDLAANIAADILQRLSDGAPLSAIAGDVGATVQFSPPMSRDGRSDGMLGVEPAPETLPSAGLVQEAFGANEGDAVMASGGGVYQVGRVETITVPNASESAAQRSAMAGQLDSALAADVLSAYSAALQERHPVQVNPQVVDALLNPDPLPQGY